MILPHIARFLLKLGGWTAVGGLPTVRKAVYIGAPHTSFDDPTGVYALCTQCAATWLRWPRN